tara:strand:+ start:1097 stop:1762 length:666 start_codon:yes stop_codon:yes gene_type:complete
MQKNNSLIDESKTIKGIYGDFKITSVDKKEVLYYRLSIISCALFLTLGLSQWFILGSNQIWIFLAGMTISLGFSLKWIHIYLRPLHQLLIFFWAIGCIGFFVIAYKFGLTNIISGLKQNPKFIFLIGPLFASLTGVGFKEFFCFRRFEAIGITIIIPITFLGYLSQINDEKSTFILLFISSLLLLILGIRKFDLPPEADIGDKSVFEFLEKQKRQNLIDLN